MSLAVFIAIALAAANAEPYPDRHQEPIEVTHDNRQEQYKQIGDYLERLKSESTAKRDEHFQLDFSSPETYAASQEKLRNHVRARIGYPPPHAVTAEPRLEHVADDAYASIYRMWLDVVEGVESYGILSIPHKLEAPAPLLICQHGGSGNPELLQGMIPGIGSGNYGWMVQRALEEGYVTYAPALIFPHRNTEEIEGPDRRELDRQLRYVGTSILALELYKIARAVDEIVKRPEVDVERIGMMGLSYGGCYTLYATALDTRIKAAVSSCYFNERARYPWSDWSYHNFLNEFADAELCGLIAPRPFLIEVGVKDELFTIDGARAEAERAKVYWEKLGVPERFVFEAFDGVHEFKGDQAYDFVRPFLRK
ncbi:MAG: acetylxylan esterase [Candidatus Hydrogenedentes bacterium]|nr:acetylxylan esterase [Candidatus Hydrogenedentota bacterium]